MDNTIAKLNEYDIPSKVTDFIKVLQTMVDEVGSDITIELDKDMIQFTDDYVTFLRIGKGE